MGIIDGRPSPGLGDEERRVLTLEAGTIFASVFIGFLDSAIGAGIPLRWDVEPLQPEQEPEDKQKELERLREAVVPLFDHVSRTKRPGREYPRPEPGYSQVHDRDHVAIATSTEVDKPFEKRQPPVPQSPWVARYMKDLAYAPGDGEEPAPAGYREWAVGLDALRSENLDHEFGAYYGIVDHPDNQPPRVISSVRCLIPYGGEPARWERGLPLHGLIGYDRDARRACEAQKQAGSFEPTGMIRDWQAQGGHGHVCGYCHGMVWAVGMAQTEFPGGIPYELALGRNTLKLASCFGCTTFLYANRIAPASMHLGRSESWVPLPEDEYGVLGLSLLGDPERAKVEVRKLNCAWETAVAGWMRTGAATIAANGHGEDQAPLFSDDAAGFARSLLDRIGGVGSKEPSPRQVASLFLDALTIHDKDVDRLLAVRHRQHG